MSLCLRLEILGIAGWLALSSTATMAAVRNDFTDGLCSYDTATPSLPKATCQFPSCPSGNDCQPPQIDRESAQVEFFEPLMKWSDTCTDKSIVGACWEVYTDYKFRLSATDPSGVAAVGVHFASEVNARRSFRKFFAKTSDKDSHGRYQMSGTMTSHVPPGQRLEIAVYEICARDGLGNEGCVLPARGRLDSRVAKKK